MRSCTSYTYWMYCSSYWYSGFIYVGYEPLKISFCLLFWKVIVSKRIVRAYFHNLFYTVRPKFFVFMPSGSRGVVFKSVSEWVGKYFHHIFDLGTIYLYSLLVQKDTSQLFFDLTTNKMVDGDSLSRLIFPKRWPSKNIKKLF